jgi:hypothetical protein
MAAAAPRSRAAKLVGSSCRYLIAPSIVSGLSPQAYFSGAGVSQARNAWLSAALASSSYVSAILRKLVSVGRLTQSQVIRGLCPGAELNFITALELMEMVVAHKMPQISLLTFGLAPTPVSKPFLGGRKAGPSWKNY